jgi:hypothetical protein
VTRVIFWALVAWLAVMAIRRLSAGARPAARTGDAAVSAEDMVRCARCSLNLPKSEAIAVEGGWACCAAHAPAPRP